MKNLLKDYWEYVENAQQEDIAGDYDLDQITTSFIKENEAKFKILRNTNESFSLDFIKWYSGVGEFKILNAFDRYIRERGNVR